MAPPATHTDCSRPRDGLLIVVLALLSASHPARVRSISRIPGGKEALPGPPGTTTLNGMPRREVRKGESSSGCFRLCFCSTASSLKQRSGVRPWSLRRRSEPRLSASRPRECASPPLPGGWSGTGHTTGCTRAGGRRNHAAAVRPPRRRMNGQSLQHAFAGLRAPAGLRRRIHCPLAAMLYDRTRCTKRN